MKMRYVCLLIIVLVLLIEPICCQISEANFSEENSFSKLTSYFENKEVAAIIAVLGIIGTIITVISGYYTFLSWNKTKKENEVYKELFAQARDSLKQKNLEEQLNITEEELKEKEGLLKNYSKEIESMQQKIYEEIPKEARKVVLEEKLYATKENLQNTYDSMLLIQNELDIIGEHVEIPEKIKNYIESEIRPDYIIREEKSKKKNYIIYLTTGATITSSLFPSPLDALISKLLLFFAAYFIYDIFFKSKYLNIFHKMTRVREELNKKISEK